MLHFCKGFLFSKVKEKKKHLGPQQKWVSLPGCSLRGTEQSSAVKALLREEQDYYFLGGDHPPLHPASGIA